MAHSRLPPLSALRAFEAAARRASFKNAAEELAVTPTAISHQIKQLEIHLGFRVLDRTPRAVRLTPPGKALLEATASGFGEIERAVTRLRAAAVPTAVTLSSTTAFLSQWLVPRLDALREAVPSIDLRLHASNTVEILHPGGIEVAIRYGRGPFHGVSSTCLCADMLTPVCSPGLGISQPDDLRRATLIHINGRNRPAPEPDWPRWCAEAGWDKVLNRAGTTFRALPEADKADLSEDKAIALMLAQPSMIKRPVLDLGKGRTIIGFKPDIYEVALAGH